MTRICCTFCDMSFEKPSRLEGHLRIHTGERPYTCECGKAYTRKQHLTRHVPKCTKSVSKNNSPEVQTPVKRERTYSCPQCPAGPFQKKKMVWAHMAIVHRERRHVCDRCDRAFPTASKLERHSSKHHGYTCHLCVDQMSANIESTNTNASKDTHFETFASLRRHIADVHPKPPLQCPTCSMRFTRPSALSAHEASHTPGGPAVRRQFICSLCSSGDSGNPQTDNIVAFTAKRNLDAHMRSVHTNFKFRCTWRGCPVILSTKQKLHEHMERHQTGKSVAFKSRYKRGSRESKKILFSVQKKNNKSELSMNTDDDSCWETASQNSIVDLLTDHIDCTVD